MQLGFIETAIGTAVGQLFRAGGDIASAFIAADAHKYTARSENKTALQIALSQERIAYALDQGQTVRTQIETTADVRQVETVTNTGAFALVAIAVLVALGTGD